MADVKIYKIIDGQKIESFMSKESYDNLPANKRGWMLYSDEKKIEIPEEVLKLIAIKETPIELADMMPIVEGISEGISEGVIIEPKPTKKAKK